MSLEGMDVDQAQGLARQLDGYGQALAHISAALAGLAAEFGHSWRGPASATFQQQCTAQYRPALSGAAQALSDMHTHLMANIQQQTRASAADSGPGRSGVAAVAAGIGGLSAGAILHAGLPVAKSIWDRVDKGNRFVLGPLDKLKNVAGNKYITGRYDKTWTRLVQLDRDSSLLRYKKSPILHWLHDQRLVQEGGKFLKYTHADKAIETLGPVGTAVGLVPVGADLLHVGSDLGRHDYAGAGGHLVDATADGLKDTKYPPLYLAGATLTLLKEDYDLGSKIDWTQVPNPLNADNFRNDYLPTFKSLPGQMVGPLEKAFL